MKRELIIVGAGAALLVLAGCTNDRDDDGMARSDDSNASEQVRLAGQAMDDDDAGEDDESEQEVPLENVPQAVRDAALSAVPGFTIERAYTETENGRLLYELVGTVDGVRHEVEVDAEGNVVEVESGPDDDE